MIHLGDFPASFTTVCIPWDSFAAATGAPAATTNFAAGDVLIYKDGGTTQRSSSAGITVSTSFDGQTGLQLIIIDLSDNTDAGFYAAGHEYQVAVADVTIDGQTVRFWAATFSIQRAGGILATALAVKAKTDLLTFTVANQIDANVLDWKGTTAPAMTGDAFARLGAPAGASTAADIAAVKTDTGAVKTVTDQLVAAQAEPTGAPTANPSPLVKIARLHQVLRNQLIVDSNTGLLKFYDDAGVLLWSKAVADVGGVFTESEGS